jgi:hypothetical protein
VLSAIGFAADQPPCKTTGKKIPNEQRRSRQLRQWLRLLAKRGEMLGDLIVTLAASANFPAETADRAETISDLLGYDSLVSCPPGFLISSFFGVQS